MMHVYHLVHDTIYVTYSPSEASSLISYEYGNTKLAKNSCHNIKCNTIFSVSRAIKIQNNRGIVQFIIQNDTGGTEKKIHCTYPDARVPRQNPTDFFFPYDFILPAHNSITSFLALNRDSTCHVFSHRSIGLTFVLSCDPMNSYLYAWEEQKINHTYYNRKETIRTMRYTLFHCLSRIENSSTKLEEKVANRHRDEGSIVSNRVIAS